MRGSPSTWDRNAALQALRAMRCRQPGNSTCMRIQPKLQRTPPSPTDARHPIAHASRRSAGRPFPIVERRTAPGGVPWPRRCARRPAAAAHRRRRRLGQDADAGLARGAAGARRRRPAAHPAAELFAPRGRRPAGARRPCAAPGAGLQRHAARARAAVGRHLPRRGCAAAARACRSHRAEPRLHHRRPRRQRRPARPAAPGAGSGDNAQALPDEGQLPGHLFARAQRAGTAGAGAAAALSLVQRMGRRAEDIVPCLRGRKAAPVRARLRRPAAVLAADAGRA